MQRGGVKNPSLHGKVVDDVQVEEGGRSGDQQVVDPVEYAPVSGYKVARVLHAERALDERLEQVTHRPE